MNQYLFCSWLDIAQKQSIAPDEDLVVFDASLWANVLIKTSIMEVKYSLQHHLPYHCWHQWLMKLIPLWFKHIIFLKNAVLHKGQTTTLFGIYLIVCPSTWVPSQYEDSILPV